MIKQELEQYEKYPEDSLQKRLYDLYFIPPQEYVEKYFFDCSDRLEPFNSFYKDYIFPILDKENRVKYSAFLYEKKPPFVVNYAMFDEFLKRVKKNDVYDEELYYFLAFIYSTNTLYKNINDFYNWINEVKYFPDKSFKELVKIKFGANFIKSNLRELPLFNHG